MSIECSIIIPTYNRAEILKLALSSVGKLRLPDQAKVELIVIDNNSPDHTESVVEDSRKVLPFPVRYFREVRQGASHARNRACLEAHYDHLVYLDDDMLVDPNWLIAYQDAQERFRPDYVVGPVDPWFEIPPPENFSGRMIRSLTSAYSQKGDQPYIVPKELGEEVPGCNFAVRREWVVRVGGFNTDIDRCGDRLLGGGDWELGEKMSIMGASMAYVPGCRIRHLVSAKKLGWSSMCRRFEDMGASARARMAIRAEKPTLRERIRLTCRAMRFLLKSWTDRDPRSSNHWYLEALWLKGFLWTAPHVPPRQWPPEPLQQILQAAPRTDQTAKLLQH